MIIIRIIIILTLFWLTLMLIGWFAKWWLIKKFKSQQTAKKESKNIDAEKLVKCQRCGTYITKESAFIKNNQTFCSKEHAQHE